VYVVVWEQGHHAWSCGRGRQALSWCAGAAYVRGCEGYVVQKPRPEAGLAPNVRALGLVKQISVRPFGPCITLGHHTA
jgi:hypothetical protein